MSTVRGSRIPISASVGTARPMFATLTATVAPFRV